jgi:hypothetical protein
MKIDLALAPTLLATQANSRAVSGSGHSLRNRSRLTRPVAKKISVSSSSVGMATLCRTPRVLPRACSSGQRSGTAGI